jgi:hypothetical protein
VRSLGWPLSVGHRLTPHLDMWPRDLLLWTS